MLRADTPGLHLPGRCTHVLSPEDLQAMHPAAPLQPLVPLLPYDILQRAKAKNLAATGFRNGRHPASPDRVDGGNAQDSSSRLLAEASGHVQDSRDPQARSSAHAQKLSSRLLAEEVSSPAPGVNPSTLVNGAATNAAANAAARAPSRASFAWGAIARLDVIHGPPSLTLVFYSSPALPISEGVVSPLAAPKPQQASTAGFKAPAPSHRTTTEFVALDVSDAEHAPLARSRGSRGTVPAGKGRLPDPPSVPFSSQSVTAASGAHVHQANSVAAVAANVAAAATPVRFARRRAAGPSTSGFQDSDHDASASQQLGEPSVGPAAAQHVEVPSLQPPHGAQPVGEACVEARGGLQAAKSIELTASAQWECLGDISVAGIPGWVSVYAPKLYGRIQLSVSAPKGVQAFLRPPFPVPCPLHPSQFARFEADGSTAVRGAGRAAAPQRGTRRLSNPANANSSGAQQQYHKDGRFARSPQARDAMPAWQVSADDRRTGGSSDHAAEPLGASQNPHYGEVLLHTDAVTLPSEASFELSLRAPVAAEVAAAEDGWSSSDGASLEPAISDGGSQAS